MSSMKNADAINCIGGYHLNPWTCGIAKFNQIFLLHRQQLLPDFLGLRLSWECDYNQITHAILLEDRFSSAPERVCAAPSWTTPGQRSRRRTASRIAVSAHGAE